LKKIFIILSASSIVIAGCNSSGSDTNAPIAPATTNATTVSPTASASRAVNPAEVNVEAELAKFCRVCVVDKGEKMPEYLPSRLNTKQGALTYKLCSDDCKKKFDATPAKYLIKS
jgi:hypothetical protein